MQFFIRAVVALAALVGTTNAAPAALKQLDVWVPPITNPNSQSVWPLGSSQTVTWDTSSKPRQITNPNGTIYLRQNNETLLDRPLASNFPLTDGSVGVTVPMDIATGIYVVVLYGDSGNYSPEFTISPAQGPSYAST